jgi:hypothetical protein
MYENIDDFVLKPQREGGGNKYFGQDIKCVFLIYHADSFKSHFLNLISFF